MTHSRLIRAIPLLSIAFLLSVSAESQFIAGHARFTVITSNLIRMEYSDSGKFVDDPSYFAVNRSALVDAKSDNQGETLTISTSELALRYVDDGKPLSADNLSIVLTGTKKAWHPGDENPGNLGGTIRTVDGVSSPVSLGEGLISRDGWYLLDDSKSVLFTPDGWVKSRPKSSGTDWYFFGYGHDYKAALRSLTAIGGDVPMPRRYSLGTYYSRYWNYSADDFRKLVQEYHDHDFPLDTMVMDMDWHVTDVPGVKRDYAGQIWTGYTWDKQLFPDPRALLKYFHEQGLAVTLNDHPADGVQPHEEMYSEFMKAMGADPSSGATIPYDAGDRHYLDTNWKFTHAPREKDGVDFWWLDWQQYPFTRSVPDLTNLAWLNEYYTRQTGADGRRGQSLSRWAGWGDHRHPIHFSGDAGSTWPMLMFEVAMTSTAGNVGCFFWSHDIGGHWGERNGEMYARWVQFGAMSPALRSHSTRDPNNDRRPWTYEPWSLESTKRTFQLRAQLFPYIYSSVAQSCRDSLPLCRPMYLEHPQLDQSYSNGQQYYFGDNLLVAPITMPGPGTKRVAWQRVWFPEGEWYDWFTGEKFVGGEERIIACDLNSFPLFVRAGMPVPMRPFTQRPATEPISTLVVRVYPGKSGSSELYEDDGITSGYQRGEFATTKLNYLRQEDTATVIIAPTHGMFERQMKVRAYRIEFPCTEKLTKIDVDGQANVAYDEQTKTNVVELPAISIERPVRVTVVAREVDPAATHNRASFDRVKAVLGWVPDSGDTDREILRRSHSSTPEIDKAPRLAALGIALMVCDDSPYFFGGNKSLRLFGPREIIDDLEISGWLYGDRKQTLPTKLRVQPGKAIDLRPLIDSLPAEATLGINGRSYWANFDFIIDDQLLTLDADPSGLIKPRDDLAMTATATASSCESGYEARGAIDGIADGYPHGKPHEWASDGEHAGARLKLTWKQPITATKVLLFDRPNMDDQILSGKLRFSDGSTVDVGELQNQGTESATLEFKEKTFDWMELEITKCSPETKHAGISEIGVFR